MKKIIAGFLAAAMTLTMLCACGESITETKKTLSYDEMKAMDWSKYVELADYSNIELDMYPDVSDTDVESEVSSLLTQYAEEVEVTDRAAQNGDTVNIDFVGKIDGVAFDNGSATGYDLVLGSKSFIDGFEDGIVGKNVGDKFELNLTFPDPYPNNPDMAGKAVVFEVTLNKITETKYPELTDDFIASNTDYDTIDEYKKAKFSELEKSAHESMVLYRASYATMNLIENSKLSDEKPEGLYDLFYDNIYETFESYAKDNDMEFSALLSAFGMTEDTFKQYAEQNASSYEESAIVLLRVAQLEDLFVKTEDEYKTEAEALAKEQNTTVEDLESQMSKDLIKLSITTRKATNFLNEHVTEVGTYSDGSVATDDTATE